VIRFLADHCFDEDILRGVLRKNAAVQILPARNVGLAEAEDPDVLRWAAGEEMVILTHDRNTMIKFAIERIRRAEPMAGLVVIDQAAPLATIIQDVLILAECTEQSEWWSRIEFVPL
jgi:predicted nuclease of predicted toxin-antitoxin system